MYLKLIFTLILISINYSFQAEYSKSNCHLKKQDAEVICPDDKPKCCSVDDNHYCCTGEENKSLERMIYWSIGSFMFLLCISFVIFQCSGCGKKKSKSVVKTDIETPTTTSQTQQGEKVEVVQSDIGTGTAQSKVTSTIFQSPGESCIDTQKTLSPKSGQITLTLSDGTSVLSSGMGSSKFSSLGSSLDSKGSFAGSAMGSAISSAMGSGINSALDSKCGSSALGSTLGSDINSRACSSALDSNIGGQSGLSSGVQSSALGSNIASSALDSNITSRAKQSVTAPQSNIASRLISSALGSAMSSQRDVRSGITSQVTSQQLQSKF